ncbi:MAG: hypothetical protein ACLSUZ_01330 [Bifidobacterium pseudocatenulatum]
MSTATLSAQEQENARINAENERLRKQATRKRRIGLGFSYFALILITILMIFPLLIVVLVSFTRTPSRRPGRQLIRASSPLKTTSRCSNVCRSAEKCSTPSSSPVP